MRNIEHKKYKGLRPKTWASIVFLCLFAAIPAAVGYQTRQYEKSLEKLNHAIQLQARAQVREYQEPPLADLPEQEKAITIIKKVWGKDWQIGTSLAKCESGYRSFVISNTNDYGLFQINRVHGLNENDLLNPVTNASFAYILYLKQGTQPWNASRLCWERG